MVAFLVLCVDDILPIGNDVGILSTVKVWLANTFDMKDLGEASYILGIKLFRDWKRRIWDYPKLLILRKCCLGFPWINLRRACYSSCMV